MYPPLWLDCLHLNDFVLVLFSFIFGRRGWKGGKTHNKVSMQKLNPKFKLLEGWSGGRRKQIEFIEGMKKKKEVCTDSDIDSYALVRPSLTALGLQERVVIFFPLRSTLQFLCASPSLSRFSSYSWSALAGQLFEIFPFATEFKGMLPSDRRVDSNEWTIQCHMCCICIHLLF